MEKQWTMANEQFYYDEWESDGIAIWGPDGEGCGAVAIVLDQTGGDLEKDAKLIATAPQLLRACEQAFNTLNHRTDTHTKRLRCVLSECLEAVYGD